MTTAVSTAPVTAAPKTLSPAQLADRTRRAVAKAERERRERRELRGKVYIAPGDGTPCRRTLPMNALAAERTARLFDANPRFLAAWTEKCPGNSDKQYVAYLPASDPGMDTLEQDFLDGEIAKALKEKDRYVWRDILPDPETGEVRYSVTNTNHRRGRGWAAYVVSGSGHCSCPRHENAGICKHGIAGVLDGIIDAPEYGETGRHIADMLRTVSAASVASAAAAASPSADAASGAAIARSAGFASAEERAKQIALDFG